MKTRIFVVTFLLVTFSFSARAGLNDGLVNWWPANGNAVDTIGGDSGVLQGGASFTSGVAGQAFSFDGSSGFVSTPLLVNNPQTFSLSLWFNTVTTQGGVLLGFGDTQTGNSPSYDRNIYMDNSGLIHFGVWTGTAQLINSVVAYNDGNWHQVVGSFSASTGLSLYVDGVLLGNNPNVTSPQAYNGYWRIGENTLAISGQPWPFLPSSFYFSGQVDEVRIYDRVLSASEIQQLYSQSDIGPAPAPPDVVQTSRAPSSTELGVQTSSSFEVFTSGSFQSGIPLNPSLMTIVLTHGWNSSSDDWPSTLASQFVAAGISANIVAWDWRDAAKSPATPWDCAEVLMRTPAQGYALGENLFQALGAGYSQPIHFIGHSFGTEVNAAAANCLHQNGFASTKIQMTLFDEAEVANDLRIVSPTTWNLGWIKPLPDPDNFAYADNYVSLVGELQNNTSTVNVILTEDQPAGFYASADALWSALISYHAVPCQWYGQTILNPSGSVMGDIWSFERNSSFTSPAGGTYFEQQGSGLSVSQITPVAAALWQQFESGAFHRDLVMFATLKGVDASVQVAGDVTANVIDTALNDSTPVYITTPATIGISSYAPATPDFWSPQLILQTQPLNLPAPQISPQAQPLDNPQATSSNSPAYAWVPMTIPMNATSLSFDFMVQGSGVSDSFAAAINGTNVFSLPLNLLQTNVVMNSGTIGVSAYAGTNIELFLGIVGGTSTNANVTISGLRVYSTMPPSLQAQASGGNLALSWPLSAQNFSLQTTTNLGDPNSWVTLTNLPAIVNLQNAVTNPISEGMRFYRLKQ
jgi:Concanavalin A-like lectin/glucanases superfamily/Alpha/beta hydrolase family